MTNKQALRILRDYQLWRRGKYPFDEMGHVFEYTPKEIGEAIDVAIKELSDVRLTSNSK
jgi:hypothetical protein